MTAGSTLRLDHLVVLVRDLDALVHNYRSLGFTVMPGGQHADGATHNALIVFHDDTYLELVAFTDRAALTRLRMIKRLGLLQWGVPQEPSFGRRLRLRGARREGLVDFVLLPAAIEQDIEAMRTRGLSIDGPFSGGRVRPDGQDVAWQLGFPHASELPFLCADVTARALRVPAGNERTHANGALGIANVTVVVADLSTATQSYTAFLGTEPASRQIEASVPRRVVFTVGSSTIALVAGDRCERQLIGSMSASLRAEDGARATPLDRRLTGGAHIDLTP